MSTKASHEADFSPARRELLRQFDRIGLEQTLYDAVLRGLEKTPDEIATQRAIALRAALDSLRAKLHGTQVAEHRPARSREHRPQHADAEKAPKTKARREPTNASNSALQEARVKAIARAKLLLCCNPKNRVYEYVIIFSMTLEPSRREELIKYFNGVAQSQGATIVDEMEWGARLLAYRIGRHNHGHYYFVTFESPQALTELERKLANSEDIVRHQCLRIDEDMARLIKSEFGRDARQTSAVSAGAPPA